MKLWMVEKQVRTIFEEILAGTGLKVNEIGPHEEIYDYTTRRWIFSPSCIYARVEIEDETYCIFLVYENKIRWAVIGAIGTTGQRLNESMIFLSLWYRLRKFLRYSSLPDSTPKQIS